MNGVWSPRVGMEVLADRFGKALITSVTQTGILVQLTELNGLEIEFQPHELTPVDDQEFSNRDVVPVDQYPSDTGQAHLDLRQPSLQSATMRSLRSIEALRFGLVPDSALEALTVGIEELSGWCNSRFPSAHAGRPIASAITGPFGTGKSHTMAVIRRLALRAGYAVARVEVDGQAVSLSAPDKLLHQLWATTRTGDVRSTTPVFDLYLRAIRRGKPAPSIAPRGIDRIRHNYNVVDAILRADQVDKHGKLMDALLSSSGEVRAADVIRLLRLERHPAYWTVQPRPMIGNTIANRPYDFVEVLAGHATVAKLAGFEGLIVTIDEFEVERVLSRAKYNRVNDLLRVLAEYFGERLDYRPAPLGMFFATVGDDAGEGDAAIWSMLGPSADAVFELQPWTHHLRMELAERIHGVYCEAYGIDPVFDRTVADAVERRSFSLGIEESGFVRAFIKRYLAQIDMDYGPPNL